MMLLFEIRAKITELYQRHDLIVKTALKFLLMFLSFRKLSKVIGYNTGLSGFGVILALSVFSAVLPPSLMVFVAAAYIFLQLITASVLIAVTVVLIFLIMYLFFLRFAPKEGVTIIATPLLCSMGFPYVVPLFIGMFGNIFSIVPAACGAVVFYLLRAVKNNIITIDELKAAKDQALALYMKVLDDLLKNPHMYIVMAIFAVVIVVVVLLRAIKMDYAFEISLGVGTGVMILSYIILGVFMYDMNLSIGKMVFGSLISMGIVFVCLFFYRVLNYSAAEHVQFEDERYYYYVTAIPKITAKSPRRTIRKVMSRSEDTPEDEDEESAIEAMNSMLANKNNPYRQELTPGDAKRLRKDLASNPEPDYDEDEDDEVVITGPKSRGGRKKAPFDSIISKLRDIGALLPAKKKRTEKPVRPMDIDEEEEEEDVNEQLYFAEDSEDGEEDEKLR